MSALNDNHQNQNMVTLWQELADHKVDQKAVDNAKRAIDTLEKVADKSKPTLMLAELHANSTATIKPGNIDDCRKILHDLAQTNPALSKDFIKAIFDKKGDATFNLANIKALGHLFYRYDTTQKARSEPTGVMHFLFLANQIHETFGIEHFKIWKTHLVDRSHNLCELLDKPEVDAVALSIATLKDKPPLYRNIWWKLVEAQGLAMGDVSYAKLWHAYQRLIKFVESHDLHLNEDSISNYLTITENFNALVFLDRLNLTLNRANKEINGAEHQQRILNNIDQIDWRHNGFYYAVKYQHFPYWKPSLELHDFMFSSSATPNYQASWSPVKFNSLESAAINSTLAI
jgi:hypothetical protein